ncbi:MAG: cysteine hydrolase [Flavobacteriaceae bacterium]
MSFKEKNPALLLIDLQKGFEDEAYWGGNRNNKDVELKSKHLLEKWRSMKLPVFHIRHSSQNPISKLHASHPGFEFCDEVTPLPNETVITKNVNSAFIGTDLKEQLDDLGITTLVIIGLTTNHCISTTTRMAGNFGFDNYLLSDVTATFDRKGINRETYDSETIHLTSLASLQDEFATIINSSTLSEMME